MNFKEMAELLLAGGYVQDDKGQRMELSPNGDIVFDDRNGTTKVNELLLQPSLLQPFYFWYDDIPEQGIICWVSEDSKDSRSNIGVVIRYEREDGYFLTPTFNVKYATPLTNEELEQLKRTD